MPADFPAPPGATDWMLNGVRPHNKNAKARPKPSGARWSAAEADAMTAAINDTLVECVNYGFPFVLDPGVHQVTGSVKLNPTNAKNECMTFVFNNAIIAARSGTPATNFEMLKGADRTWDGKKHVAEDLNNPVLGTLAGRPAFENMDFDGFAVPGGTAKHVLVDTSACSRPVMSGSLELRMGNIPDLYAIGSANRLNLQTEAGAQAANMATLTLILKQAGPNGGGILVPGRFNSPSFKYQPNAWVSSVFGKIVVAETVPYPFIVGGNQWDGVVVLHIDIANGPGSCSYFNGTECVFLRCYANGRGDNDFAFNFQDTYYEFRNFYAEWNFKAPIRQGPGCYGDITVKAGAGNVTSFADKAFIRHEGATGGGIVRVHPRSAEATHTGRTEAAVLLVAVPEANRTWHVCQHMGQGGTKGLFKPFATTGKQLGQDDQLTSQSADAALMLHRWDPAGSSLVGSVIA